MNNPRKYRGSNRGSCSRQELDFQTGGTFVWGVGVPVTPHESSMNMNMNFGEYEFMNYS